MDGRGSSPFSLRRPERTLQKSPTDRPRCHVVGRSGPDPKGKPMETTQTVSTIAVARRRLDFQAELLAAIEQESGFLGGISDFNPYGIGFWTYDEPEHIAGCATEVRRTWALEWLRAHARLIQRVGRRMGDNLPMRKRSSDLGFGVELTIRRDPYVSETLIATVPSDLTCEMVPTGEVEHIPARDVPVMERRCPESIFRGIEAEVEV